MNMTYQINKRSEAYTELVKMLSLTTNMSHLVNFKKLLEKIDVAELNLPFDKEGNTIFSLIAERHDVAALKIMLSLQERGLNIYQTNEQGENAYMLACLRGAIENVMLLTQYHYPLEAQDKKGETAFLKACRSDSVEVVQYLIEHTDCDIYAKDKKGENAIHYCGYWNNTDILEYLLQHTILDINSLDQKNYNALHIAISDGGCEEVTQFLVNQTLIDVKAQTIHGDSALSLAIYWRDTKTANLILEKGYFKSGQDFDDFFALKGLERISTLNPILKQIKELEHIIKEKELLSIDGVNNYSLKKNIIKI